MASVCDGELSELCEHEGLRAAENCLSLPRDECVGSLAGPLLAAGRQGRASRQQGAAPGHAEAHGAGRGGIPVNSSPEGECYSAFRWCIRWSIYEASLCL